MLADTNAIYFPYSSYQLVGTYYLAETDYPAPFALFLHGIPGSEKNHDLAQVLRAQGWHCLLLHFSGTWGSGGAYDIAEQAVQAQAALDFALAYPRPLHKIAVIGFSLGSRAALLAAHSDPRIDALVSLSGFSDFSETLIEDDFFAGLTPLLAGVTASQVASQFRALGTGIQPSQILAELAPRPVLVVHGTSDEIVPAYHAENFSGEHLKRVLIPDANHTYAAHRQELIGAVTGFLNDWIAE